MAEQRRILSLRDMCAAGDAIFAQRWSAVHGCRPYPALAEAPGRPAPRFWPLPGESMGGGGTSLADPWHSQLGGGVRLRT